MGLSKNKIKYVRSLGLKKFRQKYGNFVVEGDKIAKEILKDGNLELEEVFAQENWLGENEVLLENRNCRIHEISGEELKKISSLKSPNRVLIIAKQPNPEINTQSVRKDLSLYLDDIRDPGNMGTILRIADWFGISRVFCSRDCVDIYNPKVIQASMGAFLRVNQMEIAFEELQKKFPELPYIGTVLDGENIFEMDLPVRGVIIIGNEGTGISGAIIKKVTHKISIPPHPNSRAESLNAAVAAGIICAQFRNR